MITMRNAICLATLLWAAAVVPSLAANEPRLTLVAPNSSLEYTRATLLKQPGIASVLIVDDVAYKRAMRYQAMPVALLLAKFTLEADSVIQFVASDGFTAELPVTPLLNRNPDKAMAYLAVEPQDKPWPALKPGDKQTAGPFYLVWRHPERSHIAAEQWPYQIVRIEIKPSLAKRWAALMPGSEIPANSAIRRGFLVFQKNCFACHQLNRAGDATKGPDLNMPMNPTEYLQPAALRKLIRNPQSVRNWSGLSMPGFDEKALSNQELEDLLAYLHDRTHHKVTAP